MNPLAPADALSLRAGDLEAVLWPSLGGRVAALHTLGGPDWLEPIPADLPQDQALLSGGCYPMAPYCGRIDHGRFAFEGRAVALPPHPISAPHSLHGIAWQTSFVGARLSENTATMTLDHPGGGGWPWAFSLVQTVRLTADALDIAMAITNADTASQPVGLGFHPFFPRREGVELTFNAERHWRLGPTLAPIAAEAVPERMDFARPRAVVEGFDDIFSGFDGAGRIAWPYGAAAMSASRNMGDATLFSPRGRPFFCFEPISHVPNAHNRDGMPGLAVLQPGEALEVEMRLRVSA